VQQPLQEVELDGLAVTGLEHRQETSQVRVENQTTTGVLR
jgi:hypothetical protein